MSVLASPLPAPDKPFNGTPIPNNTVVLYKDDNFGEKNYTFSLNQYTAQTSHVLNEMRDNATFLGYNLPRGVVVTLMDNVINVIRDGESTPNFGGAGRTIDLIGDGTPHYVDLRKIVDSAISGSLNDRISAIYWRAVDIDEGIVELFNNSDFRGNRTCLFLGEWEADKIYSINDWEADDRVSSIRWNIPDATYVSLYDNADGSGRSYRNMGGARPIGELANLKEVGFNDRMTSFKLKKAIPIREEIKAIEIPSVVVEDMSQQVVTSRSGTNDSGLAQRKKVTLTSSVSESATVTVVQTHDVGGKLTLNYGIKAPPTGGVEKSISIELSYNYQLKRSNSAETTITNEIKITDEYNIPPNSAWTSELIAEYGKVNLEFSTTAKRWYSEELADTKVQPDGTYLRTETITGVFNGALFFNSRSHFKARPLSD